jgi:hypothetical protein
MVEWLRRWEIATEEVRKQYPDIDPARTVLRMRVFENPEAEVRLPRTVLAGRHDLRHGAGDRGLYGPVQDSPQ